MTTALAKPWRTRGNDGRVDADEFDAASHHDGHEKVRAAQEKDGGEKPGHKKGRRTRLKTGVAGGLKIFGWHRSAGRIPRRKLPEGSVD